MNNEPFCYNPYWFLISVIKHVYLFSNLCQFFWREAGFSGEVVSNGGLSPIKDCDVGPVGVVYDATSANNQPALLGFIGGLQAVQWQKQTVGHIKQTLGHIKQTVGHTKQTVGHTKTNHRSHQNKP